MADLETRFDALMTELRDVLQQDARLRAKFFAHAIWHDLTPMLDRDMKTRPKWLQRRDFMRRAKTGPLTPAAFIRLVHNDIIEHPALGLDDIRAYDRTLALAYKVQCRKDPTAVIPGLDHKGAPSWQRRLMLVGPSSTRQEIKALSFTLRRAYREPKAP